MYELPFIFPPIETYQGDSFILGIMLAYPEYADVQYNGYIKTLVNLINISYCAMKILPYQNEHFSEYQTKSVQEFRFELSQGIRSQIFFATFVKNIETHIKSTAVIRTLKQLINRQVYHL